MKYRDFGATGEKVSALGFGAMRLPVQEKDGKTVINEPEAIKMIRHAIDEGVNYVDTAYPYHDGMSEILVGKALQDGYREKTNIATKCPVWDVNSKEDFDRILNEQLTKLQTDHVDFYLLHALSLERWENTVLKHDLLSALKKAKEDGRVRYIGFSFHDNAEAFMTILNGFDGWDFCQIQMNYIDVNNQATLKGMEAASAKGLGVVIMEPLLGGKLAMPPVNVVNALDESKTPVEWALDFLWNRKEVSLLLSGMSDYKQTSDNLMYADRSSIGMLSDSDLEMLNKAKRIYDTMALVSCTKCRYCMPCPFGLDIPAIFEAYNATASKGMRKAKEMYANIETVADSCKGCKKCEKVCPQHIEISSVMKKIKEVMEQE